MEGQKDSEKTESFIREGNWVETNSRLKSGKEKGSGWTELWITPHRTIMHL